MSRRHVSVSRPHCEHYNQRMIAYADAVQRWQARQPHQWNAPINDQDPKPESPDHYCPDCRAALQQPGAVWPAEVWRYLDATAAADYEGKRPGRMFDQLYRTELPKYQKPRSIPPAKWLESAIKTFDPKDDQRAREYCGRLLVSELGTSEGSVYRLTTTNGHCALAELSAKRPDDRPPLPAGLNVTIRPRDPWIDLPIDLHAALKRVRLLANERSGAIKLAIDRDFGRILLSASSVEYGTASEYIDNGVINQSKDFPEHFEVCLAAEYLDAICGCWPVRWYVRPDIQHADQWQGSIRYSTEAQAQLFCPARTEARVLIMPMRI